MRFVTILLSLSCVIAIPQLPVQPPSQVAQASDMLEHWRRATVALGQVYDVHGKKTFVTNGSAVLVAVDGQHACLLTAKHMFFDPPEYLPTQISMRLPQEGPRSEEDLGVVIPLNVNGNVQWKTTLQESDLAVVRLPPQLQQYKDIHAVGLQDFGTADDIFQSASVIVLGYPGILGEHYQSTPIARGGMIAWTDPDNPERKPFLVDANIFGGNSGGPVFRLRNGFDRHGNLNLGGGIAFIGIVSQDAKEYSDVVVTDKETYIKKLNIPNVVSNKQDTVLAEVKNIGGIGVIEPVAAIRELLEDAYGKPRGFYSDPANIPKPPKPN